MATLQQYLTVAKETTYGTAATTGARAFEIRNSDDWTPETQMVESGGWRSGKHTLLENRTRTVQKGGTGSVQVAVLTEGMEPVLADFLGAHGATAPSAVTPATTPVTYNQVYQTDVDGPQDSWTVALGRSRVDGTNDVYTHTGCVVTGGELAVSVDEPLTLTSNYVWASSTSQTGAVPSLTYPGGRAFDWSDVAITLNGNALADAMSFSLSVDHGMVTDRFYLRQDSGRAKPVRGSVPTYTGSLELVYEAAGRAAFMAWLGGAIGSLQVSAVSGIYKFVLDIEAVRLDGSAPTASYDDLTKITLPFTVVHDGTNPAVKVTYTTTTDSYT